MSEVDIPSNFIQNKIDEDLKSRPFTVHTRFPPEPNGHLHIGHAKSICLNFGLATKYSGLCNLRFDDTNPSKEETKYVKAIQEDVKWLGFDWGDRMFYASDYFDQLFEFAVKLIQKSKAYVDDLTPDQIREYRGTLSEPGENSPFRDRSVEENLDLFHKMKSGEFAEGEKVLRAKIDMGSGNLNMRDPILYRILKSPHHRTGDKWCIYPMYDFTHGQSDSIEEVTHSLCTLEYETHRPLYDWFIKTLGIFPSRQIEYNHLYISHTMTGKRRLKQMVERNEVSGWDDPRLPTIAALRRRGVPPEVLRRFATAVGLSKTHVLVQVEMLEHILREHLNRSASRFMGVLDPIRLIITNYPVDQVEQIKCENNPEDPSTGNRLIPFSRELYIERDDFRDNPPRKWFRLSVGSEVRLKHAYYVICKEVIRDEQGRPMELRCTYDPESRGGGTPDGRKIKGTLHWVSAAHALDAEVRLYDRLFTKANMNDLGDDEDWRDYLNPDALKILTNCKLEPGLHSTQPSQAVQFIRNGYFCLDSRDTTSNRIVFNRTISLRDSWAKIEKGNKAQSGDGRSKVPSR